MLKYLMLPILLLILYQIGIINLLYIIVSIAAFVVGFTCMDSSCSPFFMKRYLCQIGKGLPKIVSEMKLNEKPVIDNKISGNPTLDKALIELVDLIMRDYVELWYQHISADDAFLIDIRRSIYEILSNICGRCRRADWISVLTEEVPNELGSHLKLYRLANQYCNRSKDRGLHREFFNLESQSYKTICRDQISTDPDAEKDYLRQLAEFILYVVCSSEDFNVPPVRYFLRETLVNGIFLPTLDLICDPDFINQYIVWMCKDNSYTSEYFIQSIRMAPCLDEVQAVRQRIDLFAQRLRSRDSGGDDDAFIKAQLGSLDFLRKICQTQLNKLEKPKSREEDFRSLMTRSVSTEKIESIPLSFVLERQVGVSLYLEYLASVDASNLLSTYINILEYRSIFSETVAEPAPLEASISSAVTLKSITLTPQYHDDIFGGGQRGVVLKPDTTSEPVDQVNFARKIVRDCRQLVGFNADLLDDAETNIARGELQPVVFDVIFSQVFDMLRDKQYLDGFKYSKYFFQFLDEIDYLRDDSQISEEELLSSGGDSVSNRNDTNGSWLINSDSYNVRIVDSEIVKNSYVQYTLVIIKTDRYGNKDSWKTYRRYRDFDSLHSSILDICGKQTNLKMPAKKPFNNMSSELVEKRSLDLQEYLATCLSMKQPEVHSLVLHFIQPGQWDYKSTPARPTNLGSTNTGGIQSLVSPLRQVGQAVMSVPDNMSRLYSATFNQTGQATSRRTGSSPTSAAVAPIWTASGGDSSIDSVDRVWARFNDAHGTASADQTKSTAENIPIRILLLLVEEIFDLQNKSQMVRRGVLGILRRIVKTFFGDKVNKIILDKAAVMTSAVYVAELVTRLKESLWPCGIRAAPGPVRDPMTQMRTRVLCRTKMLGSISDEVSQLLGNETTRQGVHRVFSLFQDGVLNRRLAHALLQHLLQRIFAGHNLERLLQHCLCPALSEDRTCEIHNMTPPLWRSWDSSSTTGTSPQHRQGQ